jgi:hypothetical protein
VVSVIAALLRLLGLVLLAAAAWTMNVTAGLAVSGMAALAVTYLPDGDE